MVGEKGFEPSTPGPKPGALPGCATPLEKICYIHK